MFPLVACRKIKTTTYNWDKLGCFDGNEQCIRTLNEKVKCGGNNSIHVHKRIKIVDSNGAELGRFNEKLLTLDR